MPRNWEDIPIDEVLNYSEGNTGKMSQYERIMRNKETLALMNVHASVHDLKNTIGTSSGRLEQRVLSLEKTLDKSSQSQSKLQWITIALTIVIALATVAYTWTTWQTVLVQKEANRIQVESQNKTSNKQVKIAR